MILNPKSILVFIKPVLLLLCMVFFTALLIGWTSNFDNYDDDTVTITFRCSQVLSFPNSYPEFVVDQCTKARGLKGNK